MSESERWVYVNDEGKLVLHTENDGHSFLRHGSQAHESPITLDEVKNRFGGENSYIFRDACRDVLVHHGLTLPPVKR
jgi:hypothetical protein